MSLIGTAPQTDAAERPKVGAIRWDCWYGQGGPVAEVERSLGPRKFHFRLPFFAEVLADDQVRINGDKQQTLEREIAYAADAGLNYWAFVDYWHDPLLTAAFRRYGAAGDKRGIKFCFIEEGSRLDTHAPAGWSRLVECFKNPHYQTVLDDRPLLFVFQPPQKLGRQDFTTLGDMTVAAGRKRPYIVLMGFNPEADSKIMTNFGFDAVSSYAAGGQYSGTMWPYAQLTTHVQNDGWETCRRLNIPTVTFATAGWDARPRIEHPVSWFPVGAKPLPDPTPAARQKPLIDAVTATPAQLAAHLRAAIAWTQSHPELNPANAIIMYAWNENDEGGWLIPTLNPDGTPNTDRLDAVRGVLRPE